MIMTLTGDSRFLIKKALEAHKAGFIAKHGELAVEKIDGEEAEIAQISAALGSQPFLAERKLVILDQPSANKQFGEQLEKLVPTLSDNTDVIIVEPRIDRRLSYYKSLKRLTDFKEFNTPSEQELPRWLVQYAKTEGGQLNLSDARYLVERVGANQQRLASEINKLVVFEPAISRKNIDDLTDPTPQSTTFELLDAALAGNSARALALYQDQRWQGAEPLKILGLIGWQLYALTLIKAAGGGNANEVAAKTGLHPFVVGKNLDVAQRLTLLKLKKLINQALELEIKLKSQSIDADEALQNYLLALGR